MYNIIRKLIVLAVIGSIYVSPVLAQPRANLNEVMGTGSYFRPLGSGSGAFNLDASYGYFLNNPAWQVGLRQSYTLNHNDDTPDVWNAVTAPFINYHFLTDSLKSEGKQTFVPYLGFFTGAVWNDEDFTGTVGPQAGVKAYMSQSTFVSLNYRYEWFFDEIGDANETQDANHVTTIGIGFMW